MTLTLQFQSKSANFRALKSSAVVNGTRYHLHPELVSDASRSTFLCHACTTATAKGKILVLSIAAGVDYGDARRLNLPALTVVEKAVSILASGRTYFFNITLTASGGSAGYAALKGHVAHFSNASPVVSYARTVAMAAEWSAATAAVVSLACASCARRPIEGEAGFPVMPVPVDNFRGLLADMAALTLSPDAEREYGALPERLAEAVPVARVPELGPGLFHLYPSMLQRGQRAACCGDDGGGDGGGGGERGKWRAAKHLKPAATDLQAHAWPRVCLFEAFAARQVRYRYPTYFRACSGYLHRELQVPRGPAYPEALVSIFFAAARTIIMMPQCFQTHTTQLRGAIFASVRLPAPRRASHGFLSL